MFYRRGFTYLLVIKMICIRMARPLLSQRMKCRPYNGTIRTRRLVHGALRGARRWAGHEAGVLIIGIE